MHSPVCMQCKVLDAGKVEFVRVQQDYQTTISIKHRERSGEFIEEISIFPRAEDSEEKEKMLLQSLRSKSHCGEMKFNQSMKIKQLKLRH